MIELLPNIRLAERRGYYAVLDDAGKPKLPQPWAGDLVAGIYDWAMQKMVFPRQFGGDVPSHLEILTEVLADVHGQRVLEVATGTARDLPRWLPGDNTYIGSDVSAALLKRAARNLRRAGRETELYLASVDDLPFRDAQFDLCLCMLALNFFPDQAAALDEIRRVLAPGGALIGCVPVADRVPEGATIRGTLLASDELAALVESRGFEYHGLDRGADALRYFRATARQAPQVMTSPRSCRRTPWQTERAKS